MWNKANVMPEHNSSGKGMIMFNRPVHRHKDSAKMATTVTEMSPARDNGEDSLSATTRTCFSHLRSSRIRCLEQEKAEMDRLWR